MNYERVINKKTREVGVTCYNSYGTDECYKYVFWSKQKIFSKIKITFKGTIIDEDIEILKVYDFNEITKDQIVKFLSETNKLDCLEPLARRLAKNYFSKGSLVFFIYPGYIPYNKESYGPNHPFIIIDILQDFQNEFYFHIILSRYEEGKGDNLSLYERGDITVTYSLLDFFKGDGFSVLSRYESRF